MCVYIYIYIYIYILGVGGGPRGRERKRACTANLLTKIPDFGGFDSNIIHNLKFKGWNV